MFTAKLLFNDECQITVMIDPSDLSFKIVEEASGKEAEGTLAHSE